MSKKKQSKIKFKRRMMLFGLVSVLTIAGVTFTIGKYWINIYDKYQEKKELEKELAELQEKQKELELDAKKLQDSEYIARYAREKYLYSKDGEYIIKIPEDE